MWALWKNIENWETVMRSMIRQIGCPMQRWVASAYFLPHHPPNTAWQNWLCSFVKTEQFHSRGVCHQELYFYLSYRSLTDCSICQRALRKIFCWLSRLWRSVSFTLKRWCPSIINCLQFHGRNTLRNSSLFQRWILMDAVFLPSYLTYSAISNWGKTFWHFFLLSWADFGLGKTTKDCSTHTNVQRTVQDHLWTCWTTVSTKWVHHATKPTRTVASPKDTRLVWAITVLVCTHTCKALWAKQIDLRKYPRRPPEIMILSLLLGKTLLRT